MTLVEVINEYERQEGECPVVGCEFDGDDDHQVTDHLDQEHDLSDKILSGSVVIHE